MYCQHALLLLMLLLNQDTVSSHILTRIRDLPLSTCTRLLGFAINELCMYGDYDETSGETYGPPVESRELESRSIDMRMHILKRCCLKPCTFPELMSVC